MATTALIVDSEYLNLTKKKPRACTM